MSLGTRTATTPAETARAALVAALAAVAGIQAHPSAPDNPSAFDAFPRWALSTYNDGPLGGPGVHQYDVLVILPAGYEPDTVSQGDALLTRVVSAIWPVGVIETADPVQLTFGNQTPMPALRIRITPRVRN